jgi:hypothetical protein
MKPMTDELPYEEWPARRFDKFPVPDTLGLGARQAAALLEWCRVPRKELTRARRRATMTERGVYILQQRFTHAITRYAPLLGAFEQSSRHVMREAELEYEWVAELTADPADEEQSKRLVMAFHEFLDADGRRKLLLEEGGDSRLRAMVRAEIKARANTD